MVAILDAYKPRMLITFCIYFFKLSLKFCVTKYLRRTW